MKPIIMALFWLNSSLWRRRTKQEQPYSQKKIPSHFSPEFWKPWIQKSWYKLKAEIEPEGSTVAESHSKEILDPYPTLREKKT